MPAPDTSSLLAWVPRLRRYARALARRREDADDLVQETLERAWVKSAHWAGVSDMRAWLFSLMHNLHVDRVRRPAVDTVEWDDAADEPVAAPGAWHDVLDLSSALARLPAEQREVLVLVAVEGLSYAEVAEVLGVPAGTVMSRLSRGRERLRELMEGRPPAVRLKVVK